MTDIGLRVYRIRLYRRESHELVPFASTGESRIVSDFLRASFAGTAASRNDERERSWASDLLPTDRDFHHGIIRYGTFGVHSEFIDPETGDTVFVRDHNSIETIPIYFMYWIPDDFDSALIAFQTYKTRSCAGLVSGDIISAFHDNFPDYRLTFQKLMPTDDPNDEIRRAPVKKMTLVRQRVRSDRFDAFRGGNAEEIEIDLTFKAKGRNRNLGNYFGLIDEMERGHPDFLVYDEIDFDRAFAEIKVGKETRKVGIFGYSNTAGTIDISEDVELGANGHPTPESMRDTVAEIIADFYTTLAS